jgi:hypothetical protein
MVAPILHAGYFILARWIRSAEASCSTSEARRGIEYEKPNADLGSNCGLADVRTHGENNVDREIPPVNIGVVLAQLRAKFAELGGEELLQYLLCEIEKWEVSRA